jgi:hypothetical protein
VTWREKTPAPRFTQAMWHLAPNGVASLQDFEGSRRRLGIGETRTPIRRQLDREEVVL